jgi:hypothetical protein
MSDVSVATPVGATADAGSPGAASNAPVKAKFSPEAFDAAELDAWADSRKSKVKINGSERELTQAELKKLASISASSDEKYKSAKQLHQEAQDLKAAIESGDLADLLKRQGKSPKEIKQILEDKLLALIEDEQLDPRERELRDLKAEKAKREEEAKKSAEEQEKSKQSAELQKMQADFEHGMVEAMQAANMPKHPYILKMVAQEMLGAVEAGYDMSPADAVKLVKADFTKQVTELLPLLGMDAVKGILVR